MKKDIKKYLIGIIIGLVISSASMVVAYSLNSSDVGFTPKNSNWQVSNVEEAVNDLYIQAFEDEKFDIIYNTASQGTEIYTITDNDTKNYSILLVISVSGNDTGAVTNASIESTATLDKVIDNEYSTNGYGRLWISVGKITSFKENDTITMFSQYAPKKIIIGIR